MMFHRQRQVDEFHPSIQVGDIFQLQDDDSARIMEIGRVHVTSVIEVDQQEYRLNAPEGRQGRHHGPRRQCVWWAFGLERWEIGCMAFIFG